MVLHFEVIRNGTVMMYTYDESCIPSLEILRDMATVGYTFRKDNKTWNLPTKHGKQKKKAVSGEEK